MVFLFAYAILRRIPSKLGGVIALIASVVVFYMYLFLHFHVSLKRKAQRVYFWLFTFNFVILT